MEMEGGLERGWGEGGGRGGPAWLRRASWSHVSLGHPCVAARRPEQETMVSTQAAVRGPGRVTLAWSGEGGVLGAGPGGWGRGLGRPGALARGRGGRCEGLKGSWGYGSGAGRKQVEAAGTGGKGTRSWADRPHCPRDPRGAASALERPRERMAPCPAFAGLCWSRRGTRPGRRARDREGSWLRAPKAGSPRAGPEQPVTPRRTWSFPHRLPRRRGCGFDLDADAPRPCQPSSVPEPAPEPRPRVRRNPQRGLKAGMTTARPLTRAACGRDPCLGSGAGAGEERLLRLQGRASRLPSEDAPSSDRTS